MIDSGPSGRSYSDSGGASISFNTAVASTVGFGLALITPELLEIHEHFCNIRNLRIPTPAQAGERERKYGNPL
jgi:hypothetical protein